MDIGGKHYEFGASSAVGFQFGVFLSALYNLYQEETEPEVRCLFNDRVIRFYTDHYTYVRADFSWDSEGDITEISLKRSCNMAGFPNFKDEDVIEVTIDRHDKYTVDARDLCYAVAKACTDVLKRCGIYGYNLSTGAKNNGYGDNLLGKELLFVKAYALDAMEVRKTTVIWRHPQRDYYSCRATPFDKEIELLLFDM